MKQGRKLHEPSAGEQSKKLHAIFKIYAKTCVEPNGKELIEWVQKNYKNEGKYNCLNEKAHAWARYQDYKRRKKNKRKSSQIEPPEEENEIQELMGELKKYKEENKQLENEKLELEEKLSQIREIVGTK